MAATYDVRGESVGSIEEAKSLASRIPAETRRGWWRVEGVIAGLYAVEPAAGPGPEDSTGRAWYVESWGARIPGHGWRLPTSDRDTEEDAAAAARLCAIVEDED